MDNCKPTLLNKNTFTYFTYLYQIHPSLTVTCNHIDISINNMAFRWGNLKSSIMFLHRSLAHARERSRTPILVLLSEAWMHRVEFWFKVSWYTTRIMIQIHEWYHWYGFLTLLWSIIRVTLNLISELEKFLNWIDNIPNSLKKVLTLTREANLAHIRFSMARDDFYCSCLNIFLFSGWLMMFAGMKWLLKFYV